LQYSIRPSVPGDEALILSFIRDLADYEKLSRDVVATETDVRAKLFCENPRAFCDIVEVAGEPAGFAVWFFNFSTFLGKHGFYLEDLFVRPAFRGKGLGKALLTHLARRAAAQGCGRLEWAVLDWNQPSIDFYKSLGAHCVDGWHIFRLEGEALRRLGE
jgi:diamine N-acetyltransferase